MGKSVRPFVTPCCPIKRTQARITKSSLSETEGLCYYDPQSSSRNSKQISRRISETLPDRIKVTNLLLITNRKSHIPFQLLPKSHWMTLNVHKSSVFRSSLWIFERRYIHIISSENVPQGHYFQAVQGSCGYLWGFSGGGLKRQ